MIYNIIITPIEFLIDWTFNFILNKLPQVGVIGAVCGVSILINFLALPLYNIADAIQEDERKLNKKMEPQIKRIKSTFSGDEQFMMIQTYYRECNYHPLYIFRSSLSILIEIPFFIAAYHYLSNCDLLGGGSFYCFTNLSKPDEIIEFLKFRINLLPVLMTLINLISGVVYSRGLMVREKVQIIVIPLIFLALLYNSPSGLVIYWILNNCFSLIKNIVLKSKNPFRLAYALITPLVFVILILIIMHTETFSKKVFLFCILLFEISFPYFLSLRNRFMKKTLCLKSQLSSKKLFLLLLCYGMALSVFCGLLLPARLIATSPQEFSYIGQTNSPLTYIFSSFSVFFGFFVFWPCCIFKMFSYKVRLILPFVMIAIFIASLLNVFIFSHDYGVISLTFSVNDMSSLRRISIYKKVLPYLVLLLSVYVFLLIEKYRHGFLLSFSLVLIISELFFSFLKIRYIRKEFIKLQAPIAEKNNEDMNLKNFEPVIHLSKTNKNVFVLFLDRAEGSFVPYISKTLPELSKQFEGFVYYPNTVSFSSFTLPASPAMLGGYEYTQEAMNLRNSEYIKDKHNEALKIMPKLFTDGGFEATLIEPIFPNYKYKGGNEIFDSIPNLKTFEIYDLYTDNYKEDVLNDDYSKTIPDTIVNKEIKNFCLLQMLFPNLRSIFYQLCRDSRVYNDYDPETFILQYAPLYYLDRLTDFDSQNDTFLFFGNETTHSPVNLDDNLERPINFNYFNKDYNSNDAYLITHYKVNCASLKAVGNWLDFLRNNDCYDNTRIIIVSDHGAPVNSNDFQIFDSVSSRTAASLNCLLLFKDFNSTGEMQVDYSFMTNADTLFLAKKNLDISDINPYTKKRFIQNKSDGVNVYLPTSQEWSDKQLMDKKQFTLDPEIGWHVKGSIYDSKNWKHLSDK